MLFVKWIILLTGCADFACSFVLVISRAVMQEIFRLYEKAILQTGWTECNDWRAFQGAYTGCR